MNDDNCVVNLVDDIWCIMEDNNFHIQEIAKMWGKDIEVVEQFLNHIDPTILTVKDLLELAALLGKRLVIKFE